MTVVLIVLLVLVVVVLAAGYYVFTTVFDNQFKGKENNDPNFIDSDGDMMRPTAGKLYAYREQCHEEFSCLPLKELEVTSFDGLKLKGYLLEGNPK